MTDTIELSRYPVWSIQDDEPPEKFAWSERFVLPSPALNLSQSYRQYQQEKGGNAGAKEASGPWREYCERYQWLSRHASYWRAKNQADLEWRGTALNSIANVDDRGAVTNLRLASHFYGSLPQV